MWISASPLLRTALLADAVASGTAGAFVVLDNDLAARWFGLPADPLSAAGLFCLAYAVLVAVLSSARSLPTPLVWAVVGGNAAWAAGTVALLAWPGLQPTGWGQAFVIGQAVAVMTLTVLQFIGLRRSGRLAAAGSLPLVGG